MTTGVDRKEATMSEVITLQLVLQLRDGAVQDLVLDEAAIEDAARAAAAYGISPEALMQQLLRQALDDGTLARLIGEASQRTEGDAAKEGE
jgi:hypothetical protein